MFDLVLENGNLITMNDNNDKSYTYPYQAGVISFAIAAFSPSHLSIIADSYSGVILARFCS